MIASSWVFSPPSTGGMEDQGPFIARMPLHRRGYTHVGRYIFREQLASLGAVYYNSVSLVPGRTSKKGVCASGALG